MLDAWRESKYLPCMQGKFLWRHADAQRTFQDMDGDAPISLVLLDPCPNFHGDKNQAQIVGLEKKFGVQA
jgi:hypothetical protein